MILKYLTKAQLKIYLLKILNHVSNKESLFELSNDITGCEPCIVIRRLDLSKPRQLELTESEDQNDESSD